MKDIHNYNKIRLIIHETFFFGENSEYILWS